MKFKSRQTLNGIAALIHAKFVGKPDFIITGINEIHVVEPGDIVFVDHPKYYDKALNSNQPNVFIGNDVIIGKNCVIHPNVCIYDGVNIGNSVTIHAGSILGADAFYYKNRAITGYDKLISCGSIKIEDNVDIGALCTIDKGVSGVTTIKEGTKLDNQVHVGHDTVIGKRCLIASQTGIAGCVIIEDNVTIWGQVGTTSGITIGEGAIIMGQTGVTKSVKGGKTYFGTPISESREKLKELAFLKRLIKNQNK